MDARCRICHRRLTDPRHAAAGIGPTCADKLGLAYKAAPKRAKAVRTKGSRVPHRIIPFLAPPLPFDVDPQEVEA